ncbi:thioesterase [Porifericola rhodea]|uniref:acyl-[acyl-carrier-protein] thioesterase n=1 Tax=Porifericola rhodea TaxID=930972 RepID=UPI0026655AED|nr:acyl-ACP thioesterase domain-containing protein [Porifericola rhodea]WKN32659.1 thioesterase [Porifericola rhodea]
MMKKSSSLLYLQSFRIRSYDVDFRRRRPDVLCAFFQEVASEHALQLGVGYKQFDKQHLFWVLSRLLLKVKRMPRWHEQIIIESWAKGTERLFAVRDFLVRSAEGEIIGRASSYWLILNTQNRRPVRPDSFFSHLNFQQDAIEEAIEKLPELRKGKKHIEHARYSDIDHNAHVNNIRYVAWMLNSFSTEHMRQYQLDSLQLNFLTEIKEGDLVEIYKQEEEGMYLINGYRQAEEQPCFSGALKWKQV